MFLNVFPYVLIGTSSAYYAHSLPTIEYHLYAIQYNPLREESGPESIYFLFIFARFHFADIQIVSAKNDLLSFV